MADWSFARSHVAQVSRKPEHACSFDVRAIAVLSFKSRLLALPIQIGNAAKEQ